MWVGWGGVGCKAGATLEMAGIELPCGRWATHDEGLGGVMRGRIEGSERESEALWFLPSDRRSENGGQ
jgi:hypothetical protein